MHQEVLPTMTSQAVEVQSAIQALSSHDKREILAAIADELEARHDALMAANEQDLALASERGRPAQQLRRIKISEERFASILRTIRTIADSADPIGQRVSRWIRSNGLEISHIRTPLGVVGLCCEARPYVFPLLATACIKVNNALLAVSDCEARHTLQVFYDAILAGGAANHLPENAIQLYCTEEHQLACRMLTSFEGKVDIAVLRGSQAFISDIVEHASIPVLKRMGRLCHIYVDCDYADEDFPNHGFTTDISMALEIVCDSRCASPWSCTAASVCLVHESVAARFLPMLQKEAAKHGILLKADSRAQKFMPEAELATPGDFLQGSLDCTLTVGLVSSLDEAIDQINKNGSKLADCIVTGSPDSERYFLQRVDSAVVYANASTNFTSGVDFGMGADIGISTDKLEPRGPIGIEGLTSLKYVVRGDGQTKASH